jgi:protein-disulfide isomerase
MFDLVRRSVVGVLALTTLGVLLGLPLRRAVALKAAQELAAQDGPPAKGWSRLNDSTHALVRGGPVSIIAFIDYECSYCSATDPMLLDVAREYAGKVTVVALHYPLDYHKMARAAAIAAECAGAQGRFALYHAAIFRERPVPDTLWERLAEEVGVPDGNRFRGCLKSELPTNTIAEHQRLGRLFGLDATPMVLVNGVRYQGHGRPEVIGLVRAALGLKWWQIWR